MKIAQVFSIFSLKYGGGTVDLVYKLCQALRKRGHEVTVLSSDYLYENDYVNQLNGVNLLTFKSLFSGFPYHVQVHSFLGVFNFTPDLIKFCRESLKEFDIIHFHAQRSIQNIIIYHFAKKYGVPYVIDAHGSTLFLKKKMLKRFYDWAIGNEINKYCGQFIAETSVGINEYRELGISDDKITLIQPPFDIEYFDNLPLKGEFRRKYDIKENYLLTFVGRIHWVKGLDFLVEFFTKLNRDDVHLSIVGADDGFKSTLDKLISELNIGDKVTFTGFLENRDKLEAFVDSDIVIQPSRYEQGAGMPFEAVLCGTPIIVSKSTGAGEDVTKIDGGYLVEFGNHQEMIEQINWMLKNPIEPLMKTKRAAKWIRENLSVTNNIELYEKVYEKCLKRVTK